MVNNVGSQEDGSHDSGLLEAEPMAVLQLAKSKRNVRSQYGYRQHAARVHSDPQGQNNVWT